MKYKLITNILNKFDMEEFENKTTGEIDIQNELVNIIPETNFNQKEVMIDINQITNSQIFDLKNKDSNSIIIENENSERITTSNINNSDMININDYQNNYHLTSIQGNHLTREERWEYLKKYWNLTDSYIIGILRKGENIPDLFWLYEARDLDGNLLEYPIVGLSERNMLQVAGIFVGKDYKLKNNSIVKLKIELSKDSEQEKRNNPFLVNAVNRSWKTIDRIPSNFIIHQSDGSVYIEESIKNHFIETQKKDLEIEISSKISEIKTELSDLQNERNKSIEYVELIKQETASTIDEKDKINSIIQNITNQKEILNNQIEDLKKIKYYEEEMLNKNLEKLKGFIKSKAEWLKKLDFISDDEYNNVMEIKNENSLNEEFIDFQNDLHGDYNKLIDQVHSFLFQNNMIYPRKLLEDFVTLLRTNDLIILAGLSGSGKTNLVKSFANAVNGKAVIIPVKPNWTSSEDLVGYYNPLQKKYLPTYFLEALIEAQRNPEKLYLICLDEMNLARVEYYFADFLSALEERSQKPEISLYSDEEAGHVLSEFKAVVKILESIKEDNKEILFDSFTSFLKNGEISKRIKEILGLNGNESFIGLHSYLRRMISGVLNIPSVLVFPENVRIIGAVNIDETTYYLSPKVLDRAHVLRFDSPLNFDIEKIKNEIVSVDMPNRRVNINNYHFLPQRESYPKNDMDDSIIIKLIGLRNTYLSKMGIDIGYRTLRQSILYKNLMKDINNSEEHIFNNILIHKILPRFSFDGKVKVDNEKEISSLVEELYNFLKNQFGNSLNDFHYMKATEELERMLVNSKKSDYIFNYWS
jgi:chorismate mutase/energy-coupling factor transporter ATP-binding protein EcfA2